LKKQNNIRIAITDDTNILRCRLLTQLIEMCGATPVLIPYRLKGIPAMDHTDQPNQKQLIDAALAEHIEHVEKTLSSCQGLLLPGNRYDIPPQAYGQEYIHPETADRLSQDWDYKRFETESFMANYALKKEWPILGVCGGMQLMNVTLGGSLVQHLPDDQRVQAGKLSHRDPSLNDLSQEEQEAWEKNFKKHIAAGKSSSIYPATHTMSVEPDSTLAELYRQNQPSTDLSTVGELSIHHQGCFTEQLADRLTPVALAPDGVVEAAELSNYGNMCLITQFHLECNVSGIAKATVQKLVDAAADHQ
jgi:putative glutamine amidotransferase